MAWLSVGPPRRQLLRPGEMQVVDPLAAVRVLAPVFAPVDAEFAAQDAGGDEGPDVEAHAVVEVWLPADGLLVQRLPAHVDVVGRLAVADQLQLLFELQRGDETALRAGLAGITSRALVADPGAQIGVDQLVQRGPVQFVVVDQRVEAVFAAVPNVPDERAVLEQFARESVGHLGENLWASIARKMTSGDYFAKPVLLDSKGRWGGILPYVRVWFTVTGKISASTGR